MQKVDLPICTACGEAPETVTHYLMDCRAYKNQRLILQDATQAGPGALSKLLGDPMMVKMLFRYIHKMQRFERTYGDLAITVEIEGK